MNTLLFKAGNDYRVFTLKGPFFAKDKTQTSHFYVNLTFTV